MTRRPLLSLVLCTASLAGVLAVATPPVEAGDGDRVSVVAVRTVEGAPVRATGRVVAAWTARVGARVSGPITAWGADAAGARLDVGSRVERGQELFRVDASVFDARVAAARAGLARAMAEEADLRAGTRPERLAAARAALAEVDARLDELRRDEQRFRRLVEDDKTVAAKRLEEVRAQVAGTVAQRDAAAARLAEAEAGATATALATAAARTAEAAAAVAIAEVDQRDTVVHAPFDGRIVRRWRGLGDFVNSAPFVEVLEVLSDRELEAELALPESRLADLRAPSARVRLASPLLAAPVEVPVGRVVGTVDPAAGTASFRVAIPADAAGALVPGAFVEGTLVGAGAEATVVVPLAAIATSEGATYAFVAKDGVMRRVPVELGDRLSDGVVVRRGLAAGDRVVVGPDDARRDGAPLPADAR